MALLLSVDAVYASLQRALAAAEPLIVGHPYLGVIVFVGLADLQPSHALMAVPSLGQHFLITALLRGDPIAPLDAAVSSVSSLALGVALALLAGRLYRRESLLG